jgi:hypothetical protein
MFFEAKIYSKKIFWGKNIKIYIYKIVRTMRLGIILLSNMRYAMMFESQSWCPRFCITSICNNKKCKLVQKKGKNENELDASHYVNIWIMDNFNYLYIWLAPSYLILMVVIGYRRKSWNFSIAENPSLLIYLWDNTKVFLSFIFFVYIMLVIFL